MRTAPPVIAGTPPQRPHRAAISVALGLWDDRPPEEALETARLADTLGFDGLWVGERETWDASVLATAILYCTRRIPLTLGPLPSAVRDPVLIARAAASVAHLAKGREVSIAIGAGSPAMVSQWHGRDHRRPAVTLRESAQALRQLLAGKRTDLSGEMIHTHGYRLMLDPPVCPLTIAAFGPRALRSAAAEADRVVFALVTAQTAAELAEQLASEAAAIHRSRPRVAVWVPVAATAGPGVGRQQKQAAVEQVRGLVARYLAAPGYGEMFTRAGFGDVVDYARSDPRPRLRELIEATPTALVEQIAIFGDRDEIREGLRSYMAAALQGVAEQDASHAEVAVLPCSTSYDPAGEHTLEVLRALRTAE
ncbi:LLM class F420-dependent oxidoreductase [Streptomyces botrytidirepellens]|uniref:LLM class F420-dependent oxidoreductase n=1 Tax=Streptomyces botrytidirepellens TaxID=2486417 RepID=A0A3M8VZK5_9ACTN|nr:LLM class F420-dependent oxidoreductase [Streptomyces botrytidirepellens]RNG21615.1 LLM class F420-dependent oxidoreductase [Streptomyces botrytidirepellens]